MTAGLVYGGWMLLDAYAPSGRPQPSGGPAAVPPSTQPSLPIHEAIDEGGRWYFADMPWMVEFTYGDSARNPALDKHHHLTSTLIPDLETLLMELKAERSSNDGIDQWWFQRGGITLKVTTQPLPQGTGLLEVDMIGEAGTLGPSLMRLSFRPSPADANADSTGHLLPLSPRCSSICRRIRSDGQLSLETVRSPEGDVERDARFTEAGWRRISTRNDSFQQWERQGRHVSVLDLQMRKSPTSPLVWVAFLQD